MQHEPEYAREQTYQLLRMFCKMLGISIKYSNTDIAIAHVDDTYNPNIEMPFDGSAFKDMSQVLAHEISHFLIEDVFFDKSGDGDCRTAYLIEHTCDFFGCGISFLAKRMVEEAEADGDNLSERLKLFIDSELS